MDINKQLQRVNKVQAKRLKELGYDWVEDRYYVNREDRIFILQYDLHETNNPNSEKSFYSAPTVALALKWFRDVKNHVCTIKAHYTLGKNWRYESFIDEKDFTTNKISDTYEAAESALLDKLLTLLEKEI